MPTGIDLRRRATHERIAWIVTGQSPREAALGHLEYEDGYRPCVGIIVCNIDRQVLWARRARHDGWQFPQGGIEPRETVEQAAYRELYEEVGLPPSKVRLVGRTHEWLHYDLPRHYTSGGKISFLGQKQIWFLMELTGNDKDICLDTVARPEFDAWCWVDYWVPVDRIVTFKRDIYRRVLSELEPLLPMDSPSVIPH